MAESKRVLQHWPVILMVLIVAAIFLIKMLTYQVDTTEYAIVLRFGEPQAETIRSRSPGLHFKLPWETLWRQDNRVQCFEGNMGEFEEIMTADGKNIVVSVFIGWKIGSDAEAMHGNKSQSARQRALDGFRKGRVRGLDCVLCCVWGGMLGEYCR